MWSCCANFMKNQKYGKFVGRFDQVAKTTTAERTAAADTTARTTQATTNTAITKFVRNVRKSVLDRLHY